MARHKLLDTDEIYAMRIGGKMSKYAIAKKLKVSEATVRYHLKKKEVELEENVSN